MYNGFCPNKTNQEKLYLSLVWQRLFTSNLSLEQPDFTKLKLFGIFDKPLINDIGQGLLGNCYLLATISSFA
jgi:hypothetical protein